MNDVFSALVAILEGDAPLGALLPGGVHTQEISRQNTPGAYDQWKELAPCAYVRQETAVPTGPHEDGARMTVLVFFYQQNGTAAIAQARQRVYRLLHRRHLAGAWDVRHADDLLQSSDPALSVGMERSRYVITLNRA